MPKYPEIRTKQFTAIMIKLQTVIPGILTDPDPSNIKECPVIFKPLAIKCNNTM
jgi:hypothetical protein